MSAPEPGRGIHPSMTLGDSIEAASSVFMDDDMLPEYEDSHPPPSEAVDDLSMAFSSPTKEFLTKNSATTGKSAPPPVGDEKRFQAETQRFSFLARPQTSDDVPAAFTFSAPKPTAGKYTVSKIPQPQLSPVLPAEKINGEDISTSSGMNKGMRSPLQSPRASQQCSPPSPNPLGPSDKAPGDILESIEFPDRQTFEPAFTHSHPDSASNLEIESHTDSHTPAPSKMPSSELTTIPLAVVDAEHGSSHNQRTIPTSASDRVKRQSHLQRPMSSHKNDRKQGSTRAERPKGGLQPADHHQKGPSRMEQSTDRPFTPSETRPAESQFRVTKTQANARSKGQERGSQPPPLRREIQTPLSEEDLLVMMANQLRERKTAEAASQAATEQLHAQVGALTQAYNDAYQKWHDAEKLCKEQDKEVAKYQNSCNRWREKVGGFQKFMNGLQNDIQAQVGESKKVQEEILSVRQAEKTIKAELAIVREQTLKERQQSSVGLVDAKKTIQLLEQHLKESRNSSENSSRLLAVERIKVTQLERVIDKQNQKYDTQLQTFQSNQSALVEKLAGITDVVHECKDSIMAGRKEGLPYLKKCKSLLEVLCEEDSIDPEAIDEIKNSIVSLSNSIDIHVRYAEKEIETNALSEQQPPVDFEAKFSGLKALLEKNHTAVERMASLQETHRSLEAQLYASENAVTVAQYEIADQDSREDLLKRRNLDLETSLKVFEDWELQRADETARNEELNHQIFLLQEALKEGDLKISNLEAELRNKDVEIQQKRQKIDEISEKLQNADVNVTSLREAVEADYEKKCEDMNRAWTNHRALEKAEEICDLRNKLSQESNSKKFAEKEVKDLKASLTKFRENDTQMKASLKKVNSQKKDLEMQLSKHDHSCQAKDKELEDLSETLQSKDADLQFFQESSDSKSAAVKGVQEKLATKEKELEELKNRCGQLEMTLEKSSAQPQLGSSLRADLEKKDEQVDRLKAEHNAMNTTAQAVEQTFRRLGLLHPMEIFNEQAMGTVAERISILQLHEAQGLVATEQQVVKASAEAASDNTSGQLAKPRRKANRSNSQRAKSVTSLAQEHGPEQVGTTTKEAQIQTTIVEHQFQGVVSTTMRVKHSTPSRNKGSGVYMKMAGHSLPQKHPTEQTPHHHDRQRRPLMGSSPLSNLRSSDVETPSGFRKGLQRAPVPESIDGTPLHASPLAPRTVPQSGVINTATNSPQKIVGELNGRIQEATKENMHGIPEKDEKRSTATYQSSHRSILKDTHSPRKRKRSSADRQESQILEKRVRVAALPSRRSDEVSQQVTSGYFASTSGGKTGSNKDTATPSNMTPVTKPASTQNSSKPPAQAQPSRPRKLKVTAPTPPNSFAPRRSTRASSKEQMMYGDRFGKENPYRA